MEGSDGGAVYDGKGRSIERNIGIHREPCFEYKQRRSLYSQNDVLIAVFSAYGACNNCFTVHQKTSL